MNRFARGKRPAGWHSLGEQCGVCMFVHQLVPGGREETKGRIDLPRDNELCITCTGKQEKHKLICTGRALLVQRLKLEEQQWRASAYRDITVAVEDHPPFRRILVLLLEGGHGPFDVFIAIPAKSAQFGHVFRPTKRQGHMKYCMQPFDFRSNDIQRSAGRKMCGANILPHDPCC